MLDVFIGGDSAWRASSMRIPTWEQSMDVRQVGECVSYD